MTQHLDAILDGTLAATPQDESKATYAAKFSRTDARLDWRESAEQLARVVRAFNPVPGAWFDMDGEAVKLWRAEVEPGVLPDPPALLSNPGLNRWWPAATVRSALSSCNDRAGAGSTAGLLQTSSISMASA